MQLPYMFHPHVTGMMYYSYTIKTNCSRRCTCSAARCTLQRRYHNFYTSQRTVRDAFSTFCNFHFLLLLASFSLPLVIHLAHPSHSLRCTYSATVFATDQLSQYIIERPLGVVITYNISRHAAKESSCPSAAYGS